MIITSLEGTILTKAHGREADYVIVPDLENWRSITGDDACKMCDRREGVGTQGVIRILPTQMSQAGSAFYEAHPEAEWYLEYFTADGELAPAPEDAVRVAAHYLAVQGIVMLPRGGFMELAHLGGVAGIRWDGPGYSVDMGEGMSESGEAILVFEIALIGLPGYAYMGQ